MFRSEKAFYWSPMHGIQQYQPMNVKQNKNSIAKYGVNKTQKGTEICAGAKNTQKRRRNLCQRKTIFQVLCFVFCIWSHFLVDLAENVQNCSSFSCPMLFGPVWNWTPDRDLEWEESLLALSRIFSSQLFIYAARARNGGLLTAIGLKKSFENILGSTTGTMNGYNLPNTTLSGEHVWTFSFRVVGRLWHIELGFIELSARLIWLPKTLSCSE